MYGSGSDSAGSEPAVNNTDAHDSEASRQRSVVDRLSRYGMQVMPGAFQRRSRLQRLQEVSDDSAPGGLGREAPEKGSLTPCVRKRYLKELLLNNSFSSNVLSSQRHNCGCAQIANKNVNNCAGALNLTPSDEVDDGQTEVVDHFNQVTRKSNWALGSFRKFFSPFSFRGSKS